MGFLHVFMLDGIADDLFETLEAASGTFAFGVLLKVFGEGQNHVAVDLLGADDLGVDFVFRRFGKEGFEAFHCHLDHLLVFLGVLVVVLLEVIEEVDFLGFLDAIAFGVLEEVLCLFVADLFGELKGFLVEHTLLLVLGLRYEIEVEVFLATFVSDFVFWRACHFAFSVEDRVAIIVEDDFAFATEIVLEIERDSAVFHNPLFQFRVIFRFFIYFCHTEKMLKLPYLLHDAKIRKKEIRGVLKVY